MSDITQPLISIVIINYNQLEVTTAFLDSCKKLNYRNYEIILVDNGSRYNPAEFVTENYPEVRFIRCASNLGFTGGNNMGIQAGSGDYFFIVNNDTEVTPGLLTRLLEPFRKDPQIGIVSPKIMYYDIPDMIQYAGYTEINPFTGRNRAIGMHETDRGQYDYPGYTHYAHGAAMLVKREVIDKIGMFFDIFFIYYEELDLSARAKKAGYKIYFQPSAVIFHKESVTTGKESPMKVYYHNRNRVLFMKRNTDPFQFLIFGIFFILVVTPKQLIKYGFKGHFNHIRNFINGIIWNFRQLSVKY